MKTSVAAVWSCCLVLSTASVVAGAEITPERLAEFYPAAWEAEAVGNTALSHMVLPGHQKAATTRYYAFGSVEFTYYDKADAVFDKRLVKMKARGAEHRTLDVAGCPTVAFTNKRAIADVGGEILAYFECYKCESEDALLARFREFDLAGLKKLLK